jgi:hypothetical protein
MCIQVPAIAIKLGGTGFEAVGDYPLQAERIVRVSSSGVNSAEGFWGIDGTAAM